MLDIPYRERLEKALVIAEQHKQDSPGNFVRISYKQAILLQRMGFSQEGPEVAQKEVVSAQGRSEIETTKLGQLPQTHSHE
jgi:hypothetical protein